MQTTIGNWLIIIGGFLLVCGIVAKTGLLGWFGNLPGDMHFKRENFQFYFPLASMLIVSVVLSGLVSLIRKFL